MYYKGAYESIIENRWLNVLSHDKENYTEVHHIVPVSLGGTDDEYNLIRVTAREHFILHALLVRIHKDHKESYQSMLYAFNMMKSSNIEHNRYFNSRLFDKYKKEYSRIVSERQSGNGNNQYGTMWITNESLKENKKILKDELIPDGWKNGRTNYKNLEENIEKYTELVELYNITELDWEDFKEDNNINCNHSNFLRNCRKYSKLDLDYDINKELELQNKVEKYTEWYELYNENGLIKFREITGYDKSKQNLTETFERYVKDFKSQNGKKRGN